MHIVLFQRNKCFSLKFLNEKSIFFKKHEKKLEKNLKKKFKKHEKKLEKKTEKKIWRKISIKQIRLRANIRSGNYLFLIGLNWLNKKYRKNTMPQNLLTFQKNFKQHTL